MDSSVPSDTSVSEPSSEDDTNEDTDDEPIYTVFTTTSAGGAITPDGNLEAESGSVLQFELLPDAGFEILEVGGTCGGTLESMTFTTEPIIEDCVVEAQFSEQHTQSDVYCSNIPAELADILVCDPNLNLDDWSQGASFSTNSLMIPRGRILSMPFTANANGLDGVMTITNNMPGLNASGLLWRGWFSAAPGGSLVEENPKCDRYSPNPNPFSVQWSQIAPHEFDCFLGTEERTLYFNMEVRCYEFFSSICTPGEFYDGDYYIGLFNSISD